MTQIWALAAGVLSWLNPVIILRRFALKASARRAIEDGKFALAESIYLEAIKLDESVATNHFELGTLYRMMQRDRDALVHFYEAWTLVKRDHNPFDRRLYVSLPGQIRDLSLASKNWDFLEMIAADLSQSQPREDAIYWSLDQAIALRQTGRGEEALGILNGLSLGAGDSGEAILRIQARFEAVRILIDLNRFDQANAWLGQAEQLVEVMVSAKLRQDYECTAMEERVRLSVAQQDWPVAADSMERLIQRSASQIDERPDWFGGVLKQAAQLHQRAGNLEQSRARARQAASLAESTIPAYGA